MVYFKKIFLNLKGLFIFPKSFADNKTVLKYAVSLFLIWRLALLFIAFLGLSVFPNLDFYNKKLFFPHIGLNFWDRWANWDSGAFMYIAKNGYVPGWTVFFPLYSIFIKFVTLFGLNTFWAGFLISQVSTIIFLFYLYKITILDFDTKVAKRTLFAILIFPTSFYLGSVYSESLFLATSISACYYARKEKWLLASLLAALASSTRLVGLGVILVIFIEYFTKQPKINLGFLWHNRFNRVSIYLILIIIVLDITNNSIKTNNLLISGVIVSVIELTAWILILVGLLILSQFIKSMKSININKILSINFGYLYLSLLPFAAYLLYQKFRFGSYLTFIKSESWWGRTLSEPWIGPLYSFLYLISNSPTTTEFTAHIYVRSLVFIISLVCLIICCYKLRPSYIAFYLIAFLFPLFSGTLADFPRYSLIIFPMFIIFGTIKNELIQKMSILFSILLLSVLTILYFNSYFFI
ncbi:hypothetical protein HYW41_03990 [Candidatus Daviesbacteria bacterium]|nr:hypothetical protein [Candidatus Daviesbacteria bacterium]